MSEEIIPLTSSFLIKTGRVYAGMSVIGNHTDLFQMAGFAPERWQELLRNTHAGFFILVICCLKCCVINFIVTVADMVFNAFIQFQNYYLWDSCEFSCILKISRTIRSKHCPAPFSFNPWRSFIYCCSMY
jgi:hypothetical protein